MSPRWVGVLTRPEVWLGGAALAAFLALFWAFRGAPLGRSARENATDDAPGPGRRDRIVVGVVAGLLLIAAGGYAALAVSIAWSLPLFALGFGAIIILSRANRRYRHDSPTIRLALRFADAALTGTLVAGVLIVGNVLAFKYGDRPLDFTRERVFTLESLTIEQLRTLNRPLRLTAFYGGGSRSVRQLDRVRQLLGLFRAENPRQIQHEVINPFTNPTEFEEVRRRAPGVALTPGGGVLVEYGEGDAAERVVVANAEMFAPAPDGSGTTFRGEDALTSALIRLREGERPRVGFLTGHGEPSLHEMDEARPGLGILRARLEGIGFAPVVVNPGASAIPSDLAVLVVAGPKTPLEPAEVDRLRAYLGQGGRLVLLLDGRVKSGLEEWLKTNDVVVGTSPVVDTTYFVRSPSLPRAPIAGDSRHPIIAPLLNQAPIVPGATPLTVGGDPRTSPSGAVASNSRVRTTVFLRTSPRSWAETTPEAHPFTFDVEKDKAGPHAVGVAVTDAPVPGGRPGSETPRFVVLSSPAFADNWALALVPSGLDVVVNSVQWLRGRPDLQGLTPRAHVPLALTADPGLRARLVLLPTMLALAAIIGLGVATYWARRM